MRTPIYFIPLMLIFAFGAQAQIPRTISYQGILTDTSGNPRPDGAYAMTFRLYLSSSGGSAIWSESKSVQLKGGLFSTSLGDATPFPGSLLFNTQYWLSVQVGAGTELAPRIAMTATPYSLSSEKADSARIAGGVGANAVTTSGIADNAVTTAKIQNGTIQFQDIAQNGAATGQVMKWNGSAWAARNDSTGTGGGGPWQLNGSDVYYNGGNVGIGTNSPGFPLNFASTSGDKISLWGQSGPHYGIGIQGGQLQIHTDIATSDILFGYGSSGAFTERMRIKGNGNVGIGNSAPNAPLAFPPALGKKITLYPGTSGDVGFGVAGNRLQIYSDNPNADVAIGYDAAGTFNERFAVKPNGALAVNGNTGTARQVLTTGGSGAPAQWQPLSGILQTYFNNQSQVTPLLTSTTTSFVFNNHSYTVAPGANSRLVLNGTFSFRSVECFACSHTEDRIRILVNGGVVGDFNFVHTANGRYSAFTVSNFMYDLTPGTYTVSFEVIHYSFSGTNAYAWLQSSSLMVIPL